MEDIPYLDPLQQSEQLKEWVDQVLWSFCLEIKLNLILTNADQVLMQL